MTEKRFSVGDKIGYGAASLGDTAVYNRLIIYSLFFMTDIVGIDPLIAGNIIFIATVWNAASVGIIGFISDHYPIKGEKRLPYMWISIFPMAVSLVMFFTVLDAEGGFRELYYLIVMVILMTAHSSFMIPYEALGADLTMNAAERTDLRGYARLFMGFGNLVGVVFLLPVIDRFQESGVSLSNAWQISILGIALIGGASQIITCVRFYKNKYAGKAEIKNENKQNLMKEYMSVLKLKPFLFLLMTSLMVCIANVFCNSSVVYFMKYNLDMGEDWKAFILAVMTVTGIIMTPVLTALSKKYDKKNIMMVCYIITGIVFIFLGAVGIGDMIILCFYIIVFTIGTSAYWQLIYAMLYDISELDEYRNDRRREAIILSMSKIVLKLSNAFSAQLLAVVLVWFGYDQNAAEQSERALWGIQFALTFIPGVLFLAAAVFIRIYPVSEKLHIEIVESLKKRNEKMH